MIKLLQSLMCNRENQKMKRIILGVVAFLMAANAQAELEWEQTGGSKMHEIVKMETAYGDVYMKLLPEVAPQTVTAFKERVQEGFYDGLYFHRVIPGFVAQGGDPELVGGQNVAYTLPAEFSNVVKHKRGSVAMARLGHDVDSATTQFYITYGEQPHLDGSYTIFAEVVKGMDAVDDIEKGDKMLKLEYLGEVEAY